MFVYILTVKQIIEHAEEWGFNLDDWKGLSPDEEYFLLQEQEIPGVPDSCRADIKIISDTGLEYDASIRIDTVGQG